MAWLCYSNFNEMIFPPGSETAKTPLVPEVLLHTACTRSISIATLATTDQNLVSITIRFKLMLGSACPIKYIFMAVIFSSGGTEDYQAL